MSKLQWQDITSYSRSDKERKPTIWEIASPLKGSLRVCVVWNHRDRPGVWVFHCYALGFDAEYLPGVQNAEEAKAAALKAVQARLNDWQKAVAEMMEAE